MSRDCGHSRGHTFWPDVVPPVCRFCDEAPAKAFAHLRNQDGFGIVCETCLGEVDGDDMRFGLGKGEYFVRLSNGQWWKEQG